MPFVTGNRGELVNLDHVVLIRPHVGEVILDLAIDGARIHAPAAVTETIVQLIPVTGQWDALVLFEDDDYSLDFIVEPVIAWALLVDGDTVPVTADSLDGVYKQSTPDGIRSHDNPTVYVPYDGRYLSIEEWMAHETLARRQARERQAARDAAKPKPAAG